jgi:hypothetical protein
VSALSITTGILIFFQINMANADNTGAQQEIPSCYDCPGCQGLGCKGVCAKPDDPDMFDFITGVTGRVLLLNHQHKFSYTISDLPFFYRRLARI